MNIVMLLSLSIYIYMLYLGARFMKLSHSH